MTTPGLQREDWDFSACLEAERSTCVHYEYAREYVRGRSDIVQRLTGELRTKLAKKLFHTQFSKHQPRSRILPILCLQFPGTPWLKISPYERQDLIELCSPQPGEGPNPDLLTDERWELSCLQGFDEMRRRQYEEWQQRGEQWVKTGGRVNGKKVSFAKLLGGIPFASQTPKHFYAYTGHINYAVITLNWLQSNNQLKQAFEQLLKRRPKAYPDSDKSTKSGGGSGKTITPKIRGGRGGPHDKFNQLGAWRLLNYFSDAESVIEFLEKSGSVLPYTNADSIRIAARKARTALRKMENEGHFSCFAGQE